ncbi:hypothetical protein J2S13_002756 [Oikeobacillus pervagus]|uniref:PRK06770 family protein n=1 Tax=Oikeobacillus pervagus TaxID=1325931 RepID=A0AAJ1WK33_9BACI|nr:DUF6241 domain-containing protein [Oikeobacillus pervagus]MDQ0216315.1 hypothetical protein [Oikeobacillus pervagus]
MEKKIVIIITTMVTLILFIGLVSVLIFQNFSSLAEDSNSSRVGEGVHSVESSQDQSEEVGGVIHSIQIKGDSTQDEIVSIMHKMTHQKVVADEKWGAIKMEPKTINEVYSVIESSNFNDKSALLAIAKKWKAGDFSDVDADHNYFWDLQGGNVGKATGLMSEEEEQKFIENNFKNHGKE